MLQGFVLLFETCSVLSRGGNYFEWWAVVVVLVVVVVVVVGVGCWVLGVGC